MHPNTAFRKTPETLALDFARTRAFGTLCVNGDPVPLLSHIPFLLAQDGGHADLHLVRSNPICKATGPARLSVTGPDAYISPDWYGVDDQVPTWNYIAVHLIGTLEPLPQETLPDMLARQSAFFETRLLPKAPWTMDKMTDDTTRRFLRMILPFRLHVDDVQSTWKLGQNKPDDVRKRAAARLTDGFGSDLAALAAQMDSPPDVG
ncbi:FMN-binding negative transcriptional regulator [Tropicibacter oceani]|uniref:FMN-binding negative transcriptional regulator n=1 Tax=Tropicibacter oceani TaxID=3058420 RepID=A0ABY8QHU3_9RHOB|nr:FMN-binding negative transcriptional regulator [Tropicibacter oceani]WGW04219.1 FMN-binding negative transcriptional regulator [Tropicibacter oceani]